MAGLGSRFKKKNFSTIKPLIKIDEKSIFEESIIELPKAKNIIAIINRKVFNKYSILQKILKKNNIKNILLNKETLGQSDTCFKAKKIINVEEDVLIHSCDYVMRYSLTDLKKTLKSADVVIFTYKLKSTLVNNYNDFAYCKNKSDNVLFVKEKKIISNKPQNDHMVIGTFWFKKFKDFLYMHEKSVQNKKFINKELYIANNINILIKKKKIVKFFEVDYWKNLGDLFSYKQYIYWKNYFRN